MIDIAPSILSADFARLGEQVTLVERAGASLIHIDVMDGRFVPNITVGPLVVEAVRRVTDLPLDVHLMIVEPEKYVADFAKAGASSISVHVEVSPHLHRTVDYIHESGCRAGIAVNPTTPLSILDEAIEYADFILVMSVNPGFGGQRFIPASHGRMRRLARTIRERGLATRIEVDGGIGLDNLTEIITSGAQVIVAGAAIFRTSDPAEVVRKMVECARGIEARASS
jgi:ribulose-phosphate 3-epimerase